MNAAIYYESDAFDTSRPKLMGRHAAGEGFLRGFVRHADADVLFCYTRTEKAFADFEQRTGEMGAKAKPCKWIPHARTHALAEPGCLFVPSPTITDQAWQRRFGQPRSYSLTGVTHTTASHAVMGLIGELLTAPLQPWDAVICTSEAVRATFAHIHERWAEYLNERTGGRAHCPAQLPVIPLGIECDDFAPTGEREKARAELRRRYGVAEDDVVVLFMGRISYHAKAHPLPMYLGLEEAARRTGKRIHLIQAGWFGTEAIEKNFVAGAKLFCPSVNAVFVDGRAPDIRAGIWFAADIFASLSENIQETFGLTPVEAMAAGLPVVVTDWNGYRETVRDGVDGLLVPTALPQAGLGEGFAYRHVMDIDNYDHYVGFASLCTAVDVKYSADAFAALVGDAGLRRRMGEAGRKRARALYDWRVVIAAYQELWRDLAARRKAETEVAPRKAGAPAHPLRDDPFSTFAHYPTTVIGPDTLLALADGADAALLTRIRSLPMNDFGAVFFGSDAEIHAVLDHLAENSPAKVSDLLAAVPAERRQVMHRTFAWLAKMGLVTIAPATPA